MSMTSVVRAHTAARAIFEADRLWDAVRPLDNQVSAAVQVDLRLEATRLTERATRWLLRLPELAGDRRTGIGELTGRFAAPVAAVRTGLPGWLLGAEARTYAERAARLQDGGVPGALAAEVAAAPLMPAALDLAVVAETTGAPIALAGRVQQCLAERLGLVPLRERVIALPRDRRWNSMARASLRDDLAAEQAALNADVLTMRRAGGDSAEDASRLVDAWVESWDSAQQRAAAQLADITSGDRMELAELLVAVRTLRGLRRRG
jgi:glutamate dehydrogenase